ncbi:hypothetical protein U1Q18_017883 [Sarracenia purpurea var. burkii]
MVVRLWSPSTILLGSAFSGFHDYHGKDQVSFAIWWLISKGPAMSLRYHRFSPAFSEWKSRKKVNAHVESL